MQVLPGFLFFLFPILLFRMELQACFEGQPCTLLVPTLSEPFFRGSNPCAHGGAG